MATTAWRLSSAIDLSLHSGFSGPSAFHALCQGSVLRKNSIFLRYNVHLFSQDMCLTLSVFLSLSVSLSMCMSEGVCVGVCVWFLLCAHVYSLSGKQWWVGSEVEGGTLTVF